jgi:hypothetical protein
MKWEDHTKYPKIQTIFKRTAKKQLLRGQYSRPEFEYLKNNTWLFFEKIDGINTRVEWYPEGKCGYFFGKIPERDTVRIYGRTKKAQMPAHLLEYLREMFSVEKFHDLYPDKGMLIYGESFGKGVGDGSGKYKPDGVGILIFDIKIDGYWLKHPSIRDIAKKLGVGVVPQIGQGTLRDAAYMCREGFKSRFGDFTAEGLIAKPKVDLLMQNKERVIAKLKHKDFKRDFECLT